MLSKILKISFLPIVNSKRVKWKMANIKMNIRYLNERRKGHRLKVKTIFHLVHCAKMVLKSPFIKSKPDSEIQKRARSLEMKDFIIFDRELCSKVLKEALLLFFFFLFLAWNQKQNMFQMEQKVLARTKNVPYWTNKT